MVITKEILDELTAKAKENPRLRCNLDMRNSADDQSQRMLNALEPGTVMPIHRHKGTSETCICIRGHFEEYFYDDKGNLTDTRDMVPGGVVLNIEKGKWHSLKCLESRTVLFEAKDGAYAPLEPDDIMKFKESKSNTNWTNSFNLTQIAQITQILGLSFLNTDCTNQAN